jgi:site-specific DNA recombinase
MERQFFSYIRVSTSKQGERGVSLKEQQDAIARYAQKYGLQITRSFEERESAAKRGRPIFLDMLGLLRRGKAHGVIIHKIDRSARNLKDWADLGDLMDIGVEVHFVNESLDLNTRGGRLSADIQAVVAADFIRNLREETRKGFYGRLKQGLYPITAPVGYLDRGAGQPKVPDPVKAPLILETFELYATGIYSLPRLIVEMHNRGLRNRRGAILSLNGISTILNNPFYVGLIRIRKTGELFPGVHTPIVGKRLFDTVQQILQGKTVPRVVKHDFVFRRLVRCHGCGFNLTAELQKGHVYYRCHTRDCVRWTFREEEIDRTVADALSPLALDEQEREYARLWFTAAGLDKANRQANELENCRKSLAQVRERLGRLADAYIDGVFDQRMLEEKRAALLLEEAGLKKTMADTEAGRSDNLARLEKYFELTKAASNLYNLALPAEKRDFVKKLTSNLGVSGEKIVITLRGEASLIANRPKVSSGSPRRGTHRTFPHILTTLLKMFSAVGVSQPQPMEG